MRAPERKRGMLKLERQRTQILSRMNPLAVKFSNLLRASGLSNGLEKKRRVYLSLSTTWYIFINSTGAVIAH